MNSLFSRPLTGLTKFHRSLLRASARRHASTPPPAPPTRLSRVEARLPRFLRPYLDPLRTAPFSHVTSFLLLHEITAVVPLFGLAAAFHYADWLPPLVSEEVVQQGVRRFGNYLRRKGWIAPEAIPGDGAGGEGEEVLDLVSQGSEGGSKIVLELATAWAVVKVLLPARLLLCVWATPWFARWTVLPVAALVRKTAGRGRAAGVGAAPPAAAGAAGEAVAPKSRLSAAGRANAKDST